MKNNAPIKQSNRYKESVKIIPKSDVKPSLYHLIALLGIYEPYFIDAEVNEMDDSFEVKYLFPEHLTSFSDLRFYTKDAKLRYLINVKELIEIQSTRFTFNLNPDELFFTKNGLPLIKTRGIKNVIEPLPITEEMFLIQYKALILCTFNENVRFNHLVEGSLNLQKGSKFEQSVIDAENLEVLMNVLNDQYKEQKLIYSQQYEYVRKRNFNIYKLTAYSVSILTVILLSILTYTYFSVINHQKVVERGYQDFVKADYTGVLNDYKSLNAKALNKNELYIYAKSYVETNKQGLDKDKKDNLLNNITSDSNKDYLLYWMVLGQGNIDEALDIATYLDDSDITKLALINKLSEIKNSPNLSSEKRSEQTKKYNDKLQGILDKEKEVKDAENKEKEKVAKEKDEKLKQQEQNEKKQKEQAQKDKEKQQEAERSK